MLKNRSVLPPYMLEKLQTIESQNQSGRKQAAEKENAAPPEAENIQKTTETRLLKILNSGSLSDFKKLNTIGAVRAKKLVELRDEVKQFNSLADLKPVLSDSAIQNFCRSNMDVTFQIE
jgi:DNA uptake protein ComE-like DNA-binding protein